MELKNENTELKKENMELKLKIQEIYEIIKPIQEEKLRIEKNFLESKIISENDEKELILKWINPKSNIKFTLLFQSSRDGDRTSTFYNKVSNKSSILIIIKSNYGYRFGGYTTLNFQNTNNYKQDEKAFIFSIDKKRNIILLMLQVLFILIVITLLLVEEMIFVLMINLKLQIQIIVVSHIHIQEEKKMSLMEEIVILQLLNVKLIMLNLNN